MTGRLEAVCVSGSDLLPLPDKRPNRSGIDKKAVAGRVEVPQEAFIAALSTGQETAKA